MTKRGQIRSLLSANEYIILILITIMMVFVVYRVPLDKKINEVKAKDIAYILETINIPREDLTINYNIGGRFVEIKDNKVIVYKKEKDKVEEDYDGVLLSLEDGKYNKLVFKKAKEGIEVVGE